MAVEWEYLVGRLCFSPLSSDLTLLASCVAFWTLTAGSEECLVSAQHKDEGNHHRCLLRLHQGWVAVAPSTQGPSSLLLVFVRQYFTVLLWLAWTLTVSARVALTHRDLPHLASVVLAVSDRRSLFQPVIQPQIPSLGCLSHRPPSLAPTPT